MALYIERERNYGADIDGNRGVDITFYEVYSDISNEELDEDDLYLYEGQVMSLDELKSFDIIDFNNGKNYSELLDMSFEDEEEYEIALEDEYKISLEDYVDRERDD